ncbi:MAG TPA: DNA cytosine methyltransferase, partial [Syntrophomonas sp.]|nr:DNA cytosine methyltransferase [Syntrophomonas sp.]HPT70535.1 DNA cytosine methyltransferase [Syntrophomonas sp.]
MIKLLYIDLFCGAGGTSTGVENAAVHEQKCAKVIACVNHDANAIASHAANHPEALHFTEDIRTLDLTGLIEHTRRMRALYPEAYLVLWASLECTNFSKAKGGQPRDADSRTLADHLDRYVIGLNPDFVQIENVEEFMSWGEVDEAGKPVTMKKGVDYIRWKDRICGYGYHFDHRILNSADFGAYTSRKRFFGQFAKAGFPIVWPEPTHTKNPTKVNLLFPGEVLKKWKAVKTVLDLDDEGESIFKPGKIKSEKTRERIYAGLIKFVAGGKEAFMIKWNSMSRTGKYVAPNIEDPAPVVSTQNRLGIARVTFISKYYSGHPEHKNISINQPAGTITTVGSQSLVNAEFLSSYYGNGANVSSIERPAPTVTTKDRLSIVSPQFLDQQFGKSKPASINDPCNAVTGNPKYNLISCKPFLMNNYSGGGQHSDIDKPAPVLTSVPKQNLVTCQPWLMDTQFNNTGSSIENPIGTITANRKWHYLMNPQFSSPGGSVDGPCFTLIARMDKMPPYLVITETGNVAIEVYETDTPMTVKIKQFMALYGIVDIKMRMLKIPELKRIMGFPGDYKLIGNQSEQKKYIGNAVEVHTAMALCSAL